MILLPDDPAFFHPHERTDLQPIARPRWWRRLTAWLTRGRGR